MKITSEMIEVFRRIFCVGRMDVYGSYFMDSGRYYVVKEPITDEVIRKHISGELPMGIFMLKGDRTAWAVVDFDKPDTGLVTTFAKKAGELGLSVHCERSKGKGFHEWMFCEEEMPAIIVRKVLRHILFEIGTPDVEVFPKQNSVGPEEYGNFVNCPLWGKLVDKRRTVFVDESFNPYVNQWNFLKNIRRVPGAVLQDIADGLKEDRNEVATFGGNLNQTSTSHLGNSYDRTFGLLPCATRMLRNGVTNMQRSSAFRLAVSLKKTGLPFETTIAVLTEWAKKNKPDNGKGIITQPEIQEQARSAYRKNYVGCGCNDEAVMPFCDKDCILRVKRK